MEKILVSSENIKDIKKRLESERIFSVKNLRKCKERSYLTKEKTEDKVRSDKRQKLR